MTEVERRRREIPFRSSKLIDAAPIRPNDDRAEGGWSREQAVAMDAKFREAVALEMNRRPGIYTARGLPHPPK